MRKWKVSIEELPHALFKVWEFSLFFERVVKETFRSGYIQYKFYIGKSLVSTMKDKYIPKYVKKDLDKITEIITIDD